MNICIYIYINVSIYIYICFSYKYLRSKMSYKRKDVADIFNGCTIRGLKFPCALELQPLLSGLRVEVHIRHNLKTPDDVDALADNIAI